MKDKEKQIEEMAKIIYETDCAVESCEYVSECIKKGIPFSRINTQLFINTKQAESLYEQGYRKIDKDSVVLSREEFEKLQKRNADRKRLRNKIAKCKDELNRAKEANKNLLDLFKIEIDKSSKETAEKIILSEISTIKDIRDACVLPTPKYKEGYIDCCNTILFYLKNNLAKQCEVEIKE